MYCRKCGTKLKDDYKYCNSCGTPISMESHEKKERITEEDLIKIYIGDNYEQIKKKKFSIPTFFLGIYYFLYRKMWLYALLSFLILIVSFALAITYDKPIYLLIQLIYTIFISFMFNSLYIKTVKKKIKKIKRNNSNKTNKELVPILKTKGGISILSIILSVIISIIIVFTSIYLLLFYIIFTEMPNKVDNYNKENNNVINSKLEYKVPNIFKESRYNYINYHIYSHHTDEASCTISVSNNVIDSNITIDEYLKNDITIKKDDTISEIEDKDINNYKWKYVEIKNENSTEYYYASIYDNRIYKVKYKINKDDNKLCSNGYNTFINTLKFQKDSIENSNII